MKNESQSLTYNDRAIKESAFKPELTYNHSDNGSYILNYSESAIREQLKLDKESKEFNILNY